MKTIHIAVLFALTCTPTALDAQERIRVFVTTKAVRPDGFSEPDLKARQLATSLVFKELRKEKFLEATQDATAVADVQIEIVGAEMLESGRTTTSPDLSPGGSFLGRQVTQPEYVEVITLRVTAGSYAGKFVSGASKRGAGKAADHVANQVSDWIKANQAKLLSARKETPVPSAKTK